jgi:hypothetical protein
MYGKKKRTVVPRYSNGRELEITEDQLKDAVSKAIEQVKWYDNVLAARRTSSSLPAAPSGVT